MIKPSIYFRADGNTQMGLGHVVRSCALARMLSDGFDCTFAIREPSPQLEAEIKTSGCAVMALSASPDLLEEARSLSRLAKKETIFVLDGYHFDEAYQLALKESGCSLVCIDDIHQTNFHADVLINHAGGIQMHQYKAAYHTRFFLGFKYALLRPPFLQRRNLVQCQRTLLICLGGADPRNNTLEVWQKADVCGFSAIHILTGSAYRYSAQLANAVATSTVPVTLHHSLGAEGVAALMQECSHAILSPSSIALEYMSFGGTLYLCQIADNQAHLKAYMLAEGLAKDVAQLSGPKTDEAMVATQAREFDGRSGERLQRIFSGLAVMQQSTVARATAEDSELTFEWANDPLSRSMSYTSRSVTRQEHEHWFASKIANADTYYYIFTYNNEAFAQIRFDKKDGAFLISYFIAPSFRKQGLGSFVLAEGLKQLRSDAGADPLRVIGFVKSDNASSCASFERMQFTREAATEFPHSYKYTITI